MKMDEKQSDDIYTLIVNIKVPEYGVWDISDMEVIEFDHTTPHHRICAFLDRHPGATGSIDKTYRVDGAWYTKGWLVSGMPTKKVGDLRPTLLGMYQMDAKGAMRLLIHLPY
jgi:hypothetical protein